MWMDKLQAFLTTNRSVTLGLVTVSSIATGASVTYFLTAKRIEEKYKKIADEEIAQVKEHYSILNKKGEYADLESLASKYEETIKDLKYAPSEEATTEEIEESEEEPETEDLPEEPEEVQNVFQSDDPETYFDWVEELARREEKPDEPYVITVDEFNNGERDFQQTTLTYYDGDDVLSDERDQPVEDISNIIGYENLLRFGHGSKDKNVVYIRNERIGLDLEVLKSEGKYSEIVLGIIEHSDKPRLRKFRDYE